MKKIVIPMTIEQARQQIKAHRIPIEDLLDELEWYRKQDLIRREDARDEMEYERFRELSHLLHIATISGVLNAIPKAEPPFAKDTNVAHNGEAEPTK